jgi:hypothetical protein
MATDPAFAAIPRASVVNFNAANANRDGTGVINTVFTPGASGSKLNRIVVKAETDPADSVVILWLQISGTWYLFKEIDLDNPAAGSTTVAGYEYELNVADRDWCLPAGVLLGATITVAPTTGDINVFALGADF